MKNEDTLTVETLLVFSLATADALVELLIQKGVISESEFTEKLALECARYQRLLQKIGRGERSRWTSWQLRKLSSSVKTLASGYTGKFFNK